LLGAILRFGVTIFAVRHEGKRLSMPARLARLQGIPREIDSPAAMIVYSIRGRGLSAFELAESGTASWLFARGLLWMQGEVVQSIRNERR